MRCKNCGTENDDNRYICETCGSPLYDEDDIENINSDSERTQTFKAVTSGQDATARTGRSDNTAPKKSPEQSDGDVRASSGKADSSAEKKGVIVIAILAVVLIAIVASVIAIANSNKDNTATDESSSEITKISTTASTASQRRETTQTTEKETEKTTEKTTTTKKTWIINVSSSGGGEVDGGGEYENGEKVVLTATPDDGYTFDGWYSNGIKVSNKAEYSFSANENVSFSAVFTPVETQPATTEATQTGTPSDTEINFGE